VTAQRVDVARVQAAAARLEERLEAARRTGAHVWIVSAAFTLSEDVARGIVAGNVDAPLLDVENLASLAPGCYACEEPLTAKLLKRRCRPV
jgi:phosphoserine phosphatase